MAKCKEQQIKMSDNYSVHLFEWNDVKKPRGVVQIVHGSCEHMLRYLKLVDFLTANQYIVIGNDIRGHGQTARDNKAPFGYFKAENGWNQIVDDVKSVNDYIHQEYPNLPVFIFGHSMGSFLVRTYLAKYGTTVKKAIICGTGTYNKTLLKIMLHIANRRIKKNGGKVSDSVLYKLSYRPLNKKFKHESESIIGWLASDPHVWAQYMQDPNVFKYFTTIGYRDLAYGIQQMVQNRSFEKTPHNLPMLFISGGDDPVGGFGNGVTKVFEKYRRYGCECELIIYPRLRHEILNEPSYKQVENDILSFIEHSLK